jgi:hypothetical protein
MSSRLAALARETVAIVERGSYTAPSGAEVRIADQVAAAIAGTRLHLPDEPLPPPATAAGPARVTVTNETSLDAARRLGGDLACLNFASAKNAGGGFLRGASAQEEDLARASALYHALRSAAEFYAFHRAQRDLRYSDRIIHSPGVPVFRDDSGALLEPPYPLSFLTAAAPNAAAIRADTPELIGAGARRGRRARAPPADPRRLGVRRVRQRPGPGRGRLRRRARRPALLRRGRVRRPRPPARHAHPRRVRRPPQLSCPPPLSRPKPRRSAAGGGEVAALGRGDQPSLSSHGADRVG